MPLDVVSVLSTAFTIAQFIHSTVERIQTSKQQLRLLSASAATLLTTLNEEFSEARILPERCAQPLADLEILLQDIHRFVDNEKEAGFMKILLLKDMRLSAIEIFNRRIGTLITRFQVSSLLNIQSILAESKEAQQKDTETLHAYLSSLEKNNTKLLQTLEINQRNTIAMMVSLQKQLNRQNIDGAEQKFYAHTLAYLTSRSGKSVKLEEWMIAAFEVDYDEEIGAGGFGTVYRGTWNRTEVAIKVLQNEAGIKPSISALRSEIDIWSTLRHPNIIQFLGANTLDDRPFVVMPFIPYNARDFLRERPSFDPLHILRDISLGLECLHLRKICHGDLKGLNVLVENSGRALLCDFGLTRLRADTTARTNAQDSLQIQGSRNWMAPELMNGSRARPPSDIYAFSMTLYELYTNEIPLFSVAYADLFDLVARRGGRPERPDPDEGRTISDELWELTEKCWSADPHTRPTATQLHDTLKSMLSRSPPPPPIKAPTTIQSEPPTSRSSEETTNTSALAARLKSTLSIKRLRGEKNKIPRTVGGSSAVGDQPQSASSAATANLEAAIGYDDHLNSLTINQDWGLGADGFQHLPELQSKILQDRKESLGDQDPLTFSAMLNLASTYHRLQLFEQAAELQLQAIEGRKAVLGPGHAETLTAMCNLAATYRSLGQLEDALRIGQDAFNGRKILFGATNLKTLSALHGVGLTYYSMKQYAGAKEIHSGILKDRKTLLGKSHNDTLISMECLALSYHGLGEDQKAKQLADRVVAERKKILGKDHPHTRASIATLTTIEGHIPTVFDSY
ncbi:kinase-like protein [Favolaschia claudopus]|uniref:Kinase-like protein n=1 Tax=Favolaschia claudopus TaxID=2862362 RepID=A0AAW0ABV9_9AGAR